ncbi:MAG: heme b synthase [Deltaproteobacteria bacterium]|nr:heme b synthase [Deltaproteobacteria bacterium]
MINSSQEESSSSGIGEVEGVPLPSTLRMVAWEVTRRCNLACVHCRAASEDHPYSDELTTDECRSLMDDMGSVASPVIILTGGEPYLREDIFVIARYGVGKGLRVVLATNGLLATDALAEETKASGIARVSISIDGPDGDSHNRMRGVPGAFEGALQGINAFKRAGVEFQINSTITEDNLDCLEAVTNLAVRLGAAAHHVFLLVPTGRGRDIASGKASGEAYEDVLRRFHELSLNSPIELKATCAPQYHRIMRQRGIQHSGEGVSAHSTLHRMTRGCLGGLSFCFISHRGRVQPCGFLDVDCGLVREQPFRDIWERSPVFQKLRNPMNLKGRCGRCEFLRVCGGCRARAYEKTGDYLDEEPLCPYEPQRRGTGRHAKKKAAHGL